MRNAEWTCRHWLDRPHSRCDLGTAIPHSALHIPHLPLCQSDALDATYRADLRELNELNFARFDAKLEQRLATLDAAWQGRWTQLDAKLEQRLAELRVELVKELAGVKSGLKWMLAFWAPTALAVIGTGAGVIRLLLRRYRWHWPRAQARRRRPPH